jgi:hypothetical protein
MSENSDQFEIAIAKLVRRYNTIPNNLPEWMLRIGIRPGARIISSERIGNEDKNNKTDIFIHLENSEPIKISAKLSNADFFGNWYGHNRFLDEFGEIAFYKVTEAVTTWANRWVNNPNSSIFVGVSICFGKRTGNTALDFLDLLPYDDIETIVAGYGHGYNVANCLIVSSDTPNSIESLISYLRPIDKHTINQISSNFKIACRPVNPLTEGSNRGKNVYTAFQPDTRLPVRRVITNPNELFKLGKFVTIEPNCLNHNHILNILEDEYNIVIPRKPK